MCLLEVSPTGHPLGEYYSTITNVRMGIDVSILKKLFISQQKLTWICASSRHRRRGYKYEGGDHLEVKFITQLPIERQPSQYEWQHSYSWATIELFRIEENLYEIGIKESNGVIL
jgi:hypothetical protein